MRRCVLSHSATYVLFTRASGKYHPCRRLSIDKLSYLCLKQSRIIKTILVKPLAVFACCSRARARSRGPKCCDEADGDAPARRTSGKRLLRAQQKHRELCEQQGWGQAAQQTSKFRPEFGVYAVGSRDGDALVADSREGLQASGLARNEA